MTFKQYINEEYLTSVKTNMGTAEVFVNPSHYEALDLVKQDGRSWELRALLHKGKLYVWNAKHSLHYPILKYLNLPQEGVTYLYANQRYAREPYSISFDGDFSGFKKFKKLAEFIDGMIRMRQT